MTNLTKDERYQLLKLQDEINADIQMMEEYYDKIEKLLEQDEIKFSELGSDLEKIFKGKINKLEAMKQDIKRVEETYGIKLSFCLIDNKAMKG